MPIDEFQCEGCGRRSSIFQRRIAAAPTATCPHCQSSNLRRLISPFAVLRSQGESTPDSDLAGLDGGFGEGDDFGDDFDD